MNEGQMVIEATIATETQPQLEVTPMTTAIVLASETVAPAAEVVAPIEVVAATVAAETPTKKRSKKAKRGPGRPQVYNGKDRIVIAAALKKHGLTNGIKFLAKERNMKISMTLARAVAEEKGLTFERGRPKVAA